MGSSRWVSCQFLRTPQYTELAWKIKKTSRPLTNGSTNFVKDLQPPGQTISFPWQGNRSFFLMPGHNTLGGGNAVASSRLALRLPLLFSWMGHHKQGRTWLAYWMPRRTNNEKRTTSTDANITNGGKRKQQSPKCSVNGRGMPPIVACCRHRWLWQKLEGARRMTGIVSLDFSHVALMFSSVVTRRHQQQGRGNPNSNGDSAMAAVDAKTTIKV